MTSALTPKQNPAWLWPAPPSTGLGGFPESIADEPRLLKPLHDGTSASFTIVGGGGDGDDEGEVEHVLLLACPWTWWPLAVPLQNPESISDWNMSTKSCCSSSKLSCLYKSNSQRLLCCHSHIYILDTSCPGKLCRFPAIFWKKNHLKVQLLVSTKNHGGYGAFITIPSFLSLWTYEHETYKDTEGCISCLG